MTGWSEEQSAAYAAWTAQRCAGCKAPRWRHHANEIMRQHRMPWAWPGICVAFVEPAETPRALPAPPAPAMPTAHHPSRVIHPLHECDICLTIADMRFTTEREQAIREGRATLDELQALEEGIQDERASAALMFPNAGAPIRGLRAQGRLFDSAQLYRDAADRSDVGPECGLFCHR